MHNRMPSRRRSPAAKGERQGETIPAQGEARTQERVPRLPHERDESASRQGMDEPSAQRMGQAGHDDIERGLVDTDKGPVLDETYDRVREGTPDPQKKFSP